VDRILGPSELWIDAITEIAFSLALSLREHSRNVTFTEVGSNGPAINNLFQMATDHGIGSETSKIEVVNMIQACENDSVFLVCDLGAKKYWIMMKDELLLRDETNMVGVAIISSSIPSWVFWQAQDWPYSEPRLFMIEPASHPPGGQVKSK